MSLANSTYSIVLANVLASRLLDVNHRLRGILDSPIGKICELVLWFLCQPMSPTTFSQFEKRLQEILREMGRTVTEFTCNECEPEVAEDAPHDVTYEAGGYRRLNERTANKYVETTFGRITLWRRGYRYWHREQKESNIFPLELILGLVDGATPMLAGEIGRLMAEGGATQRRVLEQIKRQFHVSMSVERLRHLADHVSKSMERFRHEYQVLKLLKLLKQAHASRGRYKPAFSVGRDGISLPIQQGGGYQQGAVATVTVYDRRGRRLGTVYLAAPPESGQLTLTDHTTALIKECLDKWCNVEGMPLPRLCYVTDAGDTECQYYAKVLTRIRDPRGNGKYLHWNRIIDYFHTTEKITIMAEGIFGPGREASAWGRKMRKLLLKPSGASRVLHSAAALKGIHGIRPGREKEFELAYNYIRSRSQHMQYAEFRRLKLPIGSGVTEAACKTVFTQRLKLSGMGWTHEGANVILNLRTILLSGIWDQVYDATVIARNPLNLETYPYEATCKAQIAA